MTLACEVQKYLIRILGLDRSSRPSQVVHKSNCAGSLGGKCGDGVLILKSALPGIVDFDDVNANADEEEYGEVTGRRQFVVIP
jgi:hypothetical protein